MADIFLFIRTGWKNIWKSDILWIFSALQLSAQIIGLVPIRGEAGLFWALLSLIESIVLSGISVTSTIAISYIVYCLSNGSRVSVQETLFAVKKFLGRTIGCSLLFLLVISPFLCLFIGIADLSSPRAFQLSNTPILIFSLLTIFSAVGNFTELGFFAYDLNISQSIKRAWILFTDNFIVLAIPGIFLASIYRLASSISGMLTVLIQSGFNTTSLIDINFINPSVLLGKNILFVLINGVFQLILNPFSVSIFTAAYLKYNQSK